MSAVAEPTVPKRRAERVYVSRRDELLIILVKDKKRTNGDGEVVESVQGRRLQFTDGKLAIPETGIVRGARGERIPAQEVVDHIEGRGKPGDENYIEPHDLLGDTGEGFWAPPVVAPPLSEAEAQGVVDLAIARDVEGLEALLAAEQDGWARADMLELVGSTLDKVRAAEEV